MTETNGIDLKKLNRYVGEIEKIDDELLSEKMSYASRCKPYQERKKDWKQRAADDGIPGTALGTILKERALLRSIAKLNAKVEDIDERALLADMREKIKPVADLPLFSAAIDAQAEKVAKSEGAEAANDDALGGLVKDNAARSRRSGRGKAKINDDIPEEAPPTALGDDAATRFS